MTMSGPRPTPGKKHVLFVCTHNEVRSLTAEHLYRGNPDLEVQSAGIASHAKNAVTPELLEWADLVVAFEPRHVKAIKKQFGSPDRRKNVICLGLRDKFEYKSPKLMLKLTAKLKPYLGAPPSAERGSLDEGPFWLRWAQAYLF